MSNLLCDREKKQRRNRINRREFARRALAVSGSLAALLSPADKAFGLNAPQSSGNSVNDPSLEVMTVGFPIEVSLGMQSGVDMKAYLAKPNSGGTFPAIIIIHDNTGLNDYIRDVARRTATAGYIAIAPDMLSRFGGTERFESEQSLNDAVSAVDRLDLMSDMESTISYLKSTGWLHDSKIGVVGFGWGGGKALFSATLPDVDASVVFYGNTREEVDFFARVRAPLVGIFASEDEANNQGLPALEEALKQNNRVYEIKVYDGVHAGFHDATRAEGYDASAAADAWARAITHFDKYLRS